MASKLGKALKSAGKKVKKAPIPSLIAAGSGETLIREGPKGLKTDAEVLAGIEVARRALTGPAGRAVGRFAGKAVPWVAAATGAVDAAELVYQGGKAINEWHKAEKEARASREKYGTVEAATRTRKRRQRASRIARGLRVQQEQGVEQGILAPGANSGTSETEIYRELTENEANRRRKKK